MSITAKTAELHGSTAAPTPLIIEFPMRDGAFTATIRMPMGATSSEINRMRLCLDAMERETAGLERSKSKDGLSALQRELESLDAIGVTIEPATADLTGDGWRCMYCHAVLNDVEDCAKPDCVQARKAAEWRMGISR